MVVDWRVGVQDFLVGFLKVCKICGQELPIEQFLPDKKLKSGYRNVCKPCRTKQNREWYKKNGARGRRDSWLWKIDKFYGLTEEDFEKLLAEQDGVCAICGQPETHINRKSGIQTKLSVDHDHETGEVRGLLCRNCNWAIGKLSTEDLLEKALEYVRKYS